MHMKIDKTWPTKDEANGANLGQMYLTVTHKNWNLNSLLPDTQI